MLGRIFFIILYKSYKYKIPHFVRGSSVFIFYILLYSEDNNVEMCENILLFAIFFIFLPKNKPETIFLW